MEKEIRKLKKHTELTLGEEIANAVTHGVPAVLIVFLMPFTIIVAWEKGSVLGAVGNAIFNLSIFFMFLMSALYHSMEPHSKHKRVFHILDHIGIYIAIAGSYTPVALSVIGGWQAYAILSLQWALVLFGILTKSLSKKKMPKASLAIYLIMGWTLILFLPTIITKANIVLIILIAAGGLLYSGGAIFYATKGFKYWHMIWHLFVLLGALTQYIGICFFL